MLKRADGRDIEIVRVDLVYNNKEIIEKLTERGDAIYYIDHK
jgi:hypothetical protein